MLNLENILEYIRQKLKKHAHFKILSWDEVFTRLFFFFHPGMKFHPCLSSQDEFILEWNFISAKTCKQWETFHHRQGWFHPRTSFIPGWNFTSKHPLTRWLEHHKYLSFWKLNFYKNNDTIIGFRRSTCSLVTYCNEVLKSIFQHNSSHILLIGLTRVWPKRNLPSFMDWNKFHQPTPVITIPLLNLNFNLDLNFRPHSSDVK